MEHHTTIEDLARIINEGFKIMTNKQDVAALRTEMNQKFETVELRIDRIETLRQR